jgi:hypothetical protein
MGRARKGTGLPRLGPGEVLYLFCLAWDRWLPPPARGSRAGQPRLFRWSWRELAALLGVVPLQDFSGPEAEARLQELAWLKPRVYRHQEVIAQVMRYSPVLPARFGTLFSSLKVLAELMKRHYQEITGFLRKVADQEEWAVKVLLNRATAREQLFSQSLAQQEGQLASLAPGQRYLEEQRLRGAADRELRLKLKKAGWELHQQLMGVATAFCNRPVLPLGVTAKGQELVLNWAFLLPRGAVAEFQERLQRANRTGARLGLLGLASGPWPPYSFSPPLAPGGGQEKARPETVCAEKPNLPLF